MSASPSNHKELIAFIKRISGQAGFIGTPRVYVDIFDGDLVAAVWFNQVVFHAGENDKPIGFDKTDDEFEEEIGLSHYQSRRARRLCKERGLIKTSFKKAYGTPKIHYLVLWDEFIKIVTETLERKKLEKEAKKASDLQQTKMSKKPDITQSEMSELQESVTSELTQSKSSLELQESVTSSNQEENQERINEEEEEVILPEVKSDPKLLIEKIIFAFDPEKFGKLVIRKGYLDHSAAFVLGYVAKAYQDQNNLRNPIAFIASRLKASTPPDLYYLDNFRDILPDEYLEAVGLALYECPDCDKTFTVRAEISKHWDETHAQDDEAEEDIALPEEADLEASRAWKTIQGQLSIEMPRASFESWVKHTRAISLDGNLLEIWAPTSYSREWLESRLSSTVERLAVGILNRSVSVSFVTGGVDG